MCPFADIVHARVPEDLLERFAVSTGAEQERYAIAFMLRARARRCRGELADRAVSRLLLEAWSYRRARRSHLVCALAGIVLDNRGLLVTQFATWALALAGREGVQALVGLVRVSTDDAAVEKIVHALVAALPSDEPQGARAKPRR